jgi:hypothetical protein
MERSFLADVVLGGRRIEIRHVKREVAPKIERGVLLLVKFPEQRLVQRDRRALQINESVAVGGEPGVAREQLAQDTPEPVVHEVVDRNDRAGLEVSEDCLHVVVGHQVGRVVDR